jgi:hypothetical protein
MSAWLARPRTAVWLLAGAAAIRLGLYAVFAPVFDFAATGIIHGSTAYDTYARNLLATATFGLQPGVPDAVLPPLYSASLAAVYALAGRGALQVVAMNVALDVVALMAIRRIVSRLFPSGAAVGTVAAACTACYPYLVFQSLTVVDTSLFIALLYVFLAMAVDVRSAQGSRAIWLRGTMCGAVLGLLTLTRPLAPPLVALVAAWLWLSIGARGTLARLAPVAFGAALVVTPWIVRNEAVLGVIVPVTTNGARISGRATTPIRRATSAPATTRSGCRHPGWTRPIHSGTRRTGRCWRWPCVSSASTPARSLISSGPSSACSGAWTSRRGSIHRPTVRPPGRHPSSPTWTAPADCSSPGFPRRSPW